MFAETIASFDVTDVVVAILTGAFLLAAAFVTAGAFTKRTVRRTVETTVNAHGDDEMEHLQAIEDELKMLHDELKLMRTALTASTELAATLAATQDRRVSLVEQRVLRLEAV